MRSALLSLVVLCTALPAWAQEAVDGRWRAGLLKTKFTLSWCPESETFVGQARSPKKKELHRLVLSGSGDTWSLGLQRERTAREGASDRVLDPTREGQGAAAQLWEPAGTVPLRRDGRHLRSAGRTWRIDLPKVPVEQAEDETEDEEEVLDTRPVVKVLITGFDRFPRPRNHPRWVSDRTPADQREPRINPAGWAVREFQLTQLSEAFRGEVQVELHKCLDVPVTYVNGAKQITDTIARVEPDVVISFGVGADSGDADVESTCSNVMDDSSEWGSSEQGPFQLPAAWPPDGPRQEWSPEDRAWMLRYPDNAGVSYNGAPIDPDGEDSLTSLLPVQRIVRRVEREQLRAIDGGSGPGRYICNNVMYRVVQTQAARGRLGGFIHLAQWRESRQESYLQVVACAVEESVRAFVEQQQSAALVVDARPPGS